MRRPTRRDVDRAASRLRACRAARMPGVSVGRAASFGPEVRVRVESGGTLQIGARVELGTGTELVVAAGATMVIDDDVFVGRLGVIAARNSIFIGRGTMIAELVSIRDHDHDPDTPPSAGHFLIEPTFIGRDVWIGGKASVVRRGCIEDGCVVGAHSLVNSIIPAWSVAAGAPARVVRQRHLAARGPAT